MKSRLPQGYNQSRGDMMKQIQIMQEQMTAKQAELEAKEYTAKAGGSMVEATVTGGHKLAGMKINPEVIDPDDAEMLADLVCAAVNEATRVAAEDREAEMSKITGGIDLPGLI
ncbi:MAG: YbaB/EbfC family nucleoid-associated protein [Oscillospiraceae bacterium]